MISIRTFVIGSVVQHRNPFQIVPFLDDEFESQSQSSLVFSSYICSSGSACTA
ncbi:unnamed protein product [Amoebophrya sp. A25]|nr:unnamed protein product [Amoebophrya sp. A25]|eukprot:GSA25T00016931001.1